MGLGGTSGRGPGAAFDEPEGRHDTMLTTNPRPPPATGAVLRRAVAGAALALLGACAATPGEAPDADQVPVENARVESAVKLALIETENVDAAAVRVVATEGVVTVGGFVASEDEREAVLDAARGAADGLDVVDELEVRN